MVVAPLMMRTQRLAVVALALVAALAGCTKTQESTGGRSPEKAPDVVAFENQGWRPSAAGDTALKIVRLNVTAHGDTALDWHDFHLNTTSGTLVPTSAYVRLANGTSFGWTANRTLADNETLTIELHYRAAGAADESTTGVYESAKWRVPFALPPATPAS